MMSSTMRIARYLMMVLLAIYWPSIALGTHLPQQQVWVQSANDKVMHFGSFLGLAFLLCWCVMYRQPTLRRAILILTVVLTYGFVDEMTQILVPTRHADAYDWLADCCGCFAGLTVYFLSWRVLNLVMPPTMTAWSNAPQAIPERG
jgi:VanZ family protein